MSDTRPKYKLPSFGLIDINKKKKEKEAAAAKAKAETPQGDVLSLRKDSNAATRRNSGVKGGQGFQAFGKTDRDTPGTLMRYGSPLAISKAYSREAKALEKDVYGSNAAGTKETPKKDEGRKTFGSRSSGPTSKRPADKADASKTFGSRSSGPDIKRPTARKSSPSPAPSAASPGASGSSGGDKKAGAATDKSRLAPKMTAFQRQKARQFEKEGVAGRSMTAAQAKRKASEKGSNVAGLRSLFGLSKAKSAAPNKAKKPSGPLKSAFAQISLQGRKKK